MDTPKSNASIIIRIALWVAQGLLFVPFVMFGLMKLSKPIADLSMMMPWTGQLPVAFVRFIGAVDVAGGLGVLLPAVTRIRPELGIWAARGIIALQVLAIVFHGSRGEFMMLPLNFVLLTLAIFVLWGRSRKVPITAR
ncbi:DoxX family protein [Caulobacter sp. LARHSG274]